MAAVDLATGRWLNRPTSWSAGNEVLRVVTDERTDFWRETHYGFVRDSGHFLGFPATTPMTVEVRVRARWEALYDQAGLMLRLDPQHWIKAGVEWSDGRPQLSTVVTLKRSDWSMTPLDGAGDDVRIRLAWSDGAVMVRASTEGAHWSLLRLAPFPMADDVLVGPMCCTPERAGLEVEFHELSITPGPIDPLHEPC